jgi:hypothetical protein
LRVQFHAEANDRWAYVLDGDRWSVGATSSPRHGAPRPRARCARLALHALVVRAGLLQVWSRGAGHPARRHGVAVGVSGARCAQAAPLSRCPGPGAACAPRSPLAGDRVLWRQAAPGAHGHGHRAPGHGARTQAHVRRALAGVGRPGLSDPPGPGPRRARRHGAELPAPARRRDQALGGRN